MLTSVLHKGGPVSLPNNTSLSDGNEADASLYIRMPLPHSLDVVIGSFWQFCNYKPVLCHA